jgi:PIN domain nuclease of toxin-antitoxin system
LRLLLDTHALIWWSGDRERLAPDTIKEIEDAEAVFVSPVSAYEMELKFQNGKLPGVAALLPILASYLRQMSFTVLPVDLHHASLAGKMPLKHRDPFDRILIAQATLENLTIVSNEELFEDYGVRRLW